MPDLAEICDALAAEGDALDVVVAALSAEEWSTPTPSEGWTVADQIGHLATFDWNGALAIRDADAFAEHATELMGRVVETGSDSFMLEEPRSMAPGELLDWWRRARSNLLGQAANLADDDRLPWYGPSMGAKSFFTARLMETWAHGQDVVDAVGAGRPATERLRHIAHLGVITRAFSYSNRGLDVPDVEVRVELVGPTGAEYTWGDVSAEDRVSGPLVDFCLVVTQRRHPDDTALEITGPAATDWLSKAQIFAGAPTDNRPRKS